MARLHKNEKHQWPTLIMTVVIGTMSVDSFATQEGKAEIVEAYGTLTLKKNKRRKSVIVTSYKHSEIFTSGWENDGNLTSQPANLGRDTNGTTN